MKPKTKKIVTIIIFLFAVLLVIFATIFTRNLGNLDEIWNYNFARNVANGLVPYRDFNMVQTPLLPLLASVFLNLFTNQLIIMRALAVGLNTAIFFLIYLVMRKLKINQYVVYTFLLLAFFILKDHIAIDYNFAILLVVLIMLYLEIKYSMKKKIVSFCVKYDLLLGILAGVCFTLKQSTGVVIILATVFYKLLGIRKKQELKTYGRIVAIRLLGAFIPILCLVLYLCYHQAWSEFANYAIAGMTTFSNKIAYWSLFQNLHWYIKVLAILYPITLICMIVITVFTRNKKVLILTAYGIAESVVMFPITDEIHFLIGIVPIMIGFTYIFSVLLRRMKYGYHQRKWLFYARSFLKCTVTLTILLTVIVGLKQTISYFQKVKTYNQFECYKGIRISTSLSKNIHSIDEFIQNQTKKVYILDAEAAIYKIPLGLYDKDYDMFLKGNLGKDAEQGQIEKIDKQENALFLLKNDVVSRNWQNPEQVRKYLKQNYKKIGEIEYFDIYEKR